MDRRGFMKDVGLGLGVPGFMLEPRASAAAPSTPPGQNLHVANPVLLLDGQWQLATDPNNEGREQKWFAAAQPGSQPAHVPGIFQEVFPEYHGVAWYWREFTAPTHPFAQGRYLLRFGAVAYLAEVWVNGIAVGGHEGSETPFVLDATKAIKPGSKNLVAVRVLKPGDVRIDGLVLKEIPHRNEVVDYMPGSSFDIGGICESVELLMCPAVSVADVFVRGDWKTGDVRLQIQVHNATTAARPFHLQISIAPAATGKTVYMSQMDGLAAAEETMVETAMKVEGHRLWGLEDPFLYRVTVRVTAEGVQGFDESSVRFGFRDFRVEKGYFRLNGKRLFLRSTHTGNHCPIRQTLPPDGAPDFLRQDMLYAKASGFNTVRIISGMAHPYQLDMCDEIGLLVYEESLAAWDLTDSPKMKERFDFSVREMVLRDRNHPCLALWGMLNETYNGPVFRAAAAALDVVRKEDDSRLVLLSSGRWDGQINIGSICNPGNSDWEYAWGTEAPGAAPIDTKDHHDFWWKTGDIHFYPKTPQNEETDRKLRTLGQGTKPVFQSEYGIGSMMDVIHEARMYEQLGVRPDIQDYVIVKSMADRFAADWKRFGMDGVFPFPEFMLRDSQARMARHRLLGFNVLRSNPQNAGFNLTGMLDHALTGEGVWRFWRDWKPGAMDAIRDGWCPLRWCLFVYPTHSYTGRPIKLEAVLANEDVLRPGDYPVRFRVCGPLGIAWENSTTVHVPELPPGEDGPMAIPVLEQEIHLPGPEGDYELAVSIEKGAAATEASWQFHLTDANSLPRINQSVTLWGVPSNVQEWLTVHGAKCKQPGEGGNLTREIVLVGDLSAPGPVWDWQGLVSLIARGNVVVFLATGVSIEE